MRQQRVAEDERAGNADIGEHEQPGTEHPVALVDEECPIRGPDPQKQ